MTASFRSIDQVADLWGKIRAWLDKHHREALSGLRGPAPEFAIEDLRDRWQLSEDNELLASLRLVDGDEEGCEFVFGGFNHLLPVSEITSIADHQLSRAKSRAGLDCIPEGRNVRTIGPVRAAFWGTGWIPFMRSNAIPYCLDLKPSAGGRIGQIIRVDKEDNLISVVAGSYLEFMTTATVAMIAGEAFPFEHK